MAARRFKVTYMACIYGLHCISVATLGNNISGILPENKGRENRRENWIAQSLKESFFNDKSVLILFIILVEINSMKKKKNIEYLLFIRVIVHIKFSIF